MMIGLSSVSETSRLLAVGELWALAVSNRDVHGCLTDDSSISVTITKPDGSTASPAPVAERTEIGTYVAQYTVGPVGRYVAHVASDTDAVDFAAYVNDVTTESGMPVVGDLVKYLGAGAASWSQDALQDALNVEAQAQRDKCNVPAVYPDSLRGALLRRAQVNLAMRSLPLAMAAGDADSGPVVLPRNDPMVRRLEAAYPKLVFG